MPVPRDPAACAICALALALAFFALFGLGMLALERRRAKSKTKARPALAPAPPAPPPSGAPTRPYPPEAAAAAWGGAYDDADTRIDRRPAGSRAARAAAPTEPYPVRRPQAIRPPAPPWSPRSTLSTSPGEIADALEAEAEREHAEAIADVKRMRESAGKPIPVPPDFRKKKE